LLFEMFLKILHIEQNTRQYFLVLCNVIRFLTAELQLSGMCHDGTEGRVTTVPCTTRTSVFKFAAWPLDSYRERPWNRRTGGTQNWVTHLQINLFPLSDIYRLLVRPICSPVTIPNELSQLAKT